MGCTGSKNVPQASRPQTDRSLATGLPSSSAHPRPASAASPGGAIHPVAEGAPAPDDPIYTTKLPATGQPKELRSGLLAAIETTVEGATKDFFIESNLGHGSFGEVFRARHRHHSSRTVALKVMARDRIKVTSIQREFAVMEAMGSHPGIVGYHGAYKTADKVTFVLELMNGGELFERLVHKGAYTEQEARPAFRRVARALAYLHSRGIVHRDLKPENLLLKEDSYSSEIKIADFGLSQLIRPSEKLVKVCGTWAYAAPEMSDSGRPGYDTRFDTWGFGVILSVVLTGFHPFDPEGGLPVDTIKHRARNAIWSFDQPEWSTISPQGRDLIQKLIVKDPARRLSAAQMADHPWLRDYVPLPAVPGKPGASSAPAEAAETTEDGGDPDGGVVAKPFDPALWLTRTERVRSRGAPPRSTIPPPGDPDDLLREAAKYLASPGAFGARRPRPGARQEAGRLGPEARAALATTEPPAADAAASAIAAKQASSAGGDPVAMAVVAAADAGGSSVLGSTSGMESRPPSGARPGELTGAAAATTSGGPDTGPPTTAAVAAGHRHAGPTTRGSRPVRHKATEAQAAQAPPVLHCPAPMVELVELAPGDVVPEHTAGPVLRAAEGRAGACAAGSSGRPAFRAQSRRLQLLQGKLDRAAAFRRQARGMPGTAAPVLDSAADQSFGCSAAPVGSPRAAPPAWPGARYQTGAEDAGGSFPDGGASAHAARGSLAGSSGLVVLPEDVVVLRLPTDSPGDPATVMLRTFLADGSPGALLPLGPAGPTLAHLGPQAAGLVPPTEARPPGKAIGALSTDEKPERRRRRSSVKAGTEEPDYEAASESVASTAAPQRPADSARADVPPTVGAQPSPAPSGFESAGHDAPAGLAGRAAWGLGSCSFAEGDCGDGSYDGESTSGSESILTEGALRAMMAGQRPTLAAGAGDSDDGRLRESASSEGDDA